ncbi:MAG: hypothetical protein ABSE49_17125 [Polyangiaceae bacterium]
MLLGLLGSLALWGCRGEVALGGEEGDGGSEGSAQATSSSSGTGGSSSSGTAGSSSSGSTGTGAACPTVVLQGLQSVQDIATAVQGSWVVCDYLSNLFPGWAPSDTVGMQFMAAMAGGGSCDSKSGCMGGLVYFLVQGSSGLTPGNGNAYQIWYSIFESELTLAQSPNGGTWSTSVSASSSPREFWIEQLSYMDGPRLVAAP